MSKNNRYTPPELKKFIKLFDSIAIRHNQFKVFDDFLDLFINFFSFNHRIDLDYIKSTYTQEHRNTFGELIKETLFIIQRESKTVNDYYDVFGSFYELHSLTNKKFGQFFTPISIIDFMANILTPQGGEFMPDPCCGSGRFSLAANKVNLGLFHSLVDKDYTCAKMSALNLMLHGIDGIVLNDNGLFPSKEFNGAFIVNRNLKLEKVPRIEFVSDVNEAYNYIRKRVGVEEKKEPPKKEEKINNNNDDIKDIIVNPKTNQIRMF